MLVAVLVAAILQIAFLLALLFVAGFAPWLSPQTPLLQQAVALAVLILGAMVVYFGFAFAIGGADLGMIRRNVRRERGG